MSDKQLASKEEMKAEAVYRMTAIGLRKEYIDSFEREYCITCFGVDNDTVEMVNEKQDALISICEKDHSRLVWAVIHDRYKDDGEDGDVFIMLYVSVDKDMWEDEGELIGFGNQSAFLTGIGEESGRQWTDDRSFNIDVVDGKLNVGGDEYNTLFDAVLYEEGDKYEGDYYSVDMSLKDNGLLYFKMCYPSMDAFRMCFYYLKRVEYAKLSQALGTCTYQETEEKLKNALGFDKITSLDGAGTLGINAFLQLERYLRENQISYEQKSFTLKNYFCED